MGVGGIYSIFVASEGYTSARTFVLAVIDE